MRRSRRSARIGVHPRVCGGAPATPSLSPTHCGPSPRVRGSRLSWRVRMSSHGSIPACAGSIPACAGEPCVASRSPRLFWVHPRVCGGAIGNVSVVWTPSGPSPRVRGSPSILAVCLDFSRSIPACAGEPIPGPSRPAPRRVHPRVCGGAVSHPDGIRRGLGPSPRVRGSRSPASPRRSRARSIPACAGEPRRTSRLPRGRRVHPRVCGGACGSMSNPVIVEGPSPRVRGEPPALR